MKKNILLTIIFTVISGLVFSQEATLVDISAYVTCEKALLISTTHTFGPTTAPVEDAQSPDEKNFERKKHLVWYKFVAESSGKLLIDIIPLDSLDDYDFIIYKAGNGNICSNIGSITPLRSNFEKINYARKGATGLWHTEFETAYSEGIEVTKGETYYVVLNNVYENGKGHTITFTYLETFVVKGQVFDSETEKPVKAEVTWENIRTGELLAKTTCDKDGFFTLNVSVSIEAHKFPSYDLTIYDDKYLIADTIIPSKALETLRDTIFSFGLKKLKKGISSDLGNIYFDPNYATVVPNSLIIVNRIYKLMKRSPKIEIQIEGHTNGYWPSTNVDQVLSEKRAEVVRDLLIEKGISKDRLTIKGHGSTQLLYPKASDEIEESYNRRVEINFTKLK